MNSASAKKAKKLATKKMFFWSIITAITLSTLVTGGLSLIHMMGLIANYCGKYPGIVATGVNEMFPGMSVLFIYVFTIFGTIIISSVAKKLEKEDDSKEESRFYRV